MKKHSGISASFGTALCVFLFLILAAAFTAGQKDSGTSQDNGFRQTSVLTGTKALPAESASVSFKKYFSRRPGIQNSCHDFSAISVLRNHSLLIPYAPNAEPDISFAGIRFYYHLFSSCSGEDPLAG